MGAEFKVVKVDPEGSGMDYAGHLGVTIYNGARCCKNCTIIFGSFAQVSYDPSQPETADNDPRPIGPFVAGELAPLNEEARQIVEEIQKDHPWTVERFNPPGLWQRMKDFFWRMANAWPH